LTGHLIYVGSDDDASYSQPQPVFAGHLQTGNYVIVNTSGNVGRARVVDVKWSRDPAGGVYAPITARGTLVVDDVIVSCYAEFSSHSTAHASLAPLRYFYLSADWLSHWLSTSWRRGDADVDGVHWYAALLRRLASLVVPTHYWWSTTHTV